MAETYSGPPVQVDRVVLHAPTQTLRVYAHSHTSLKYTEYCEAVQWLNEQAAALGDIPKEILLLNIAETQADIGQFYTELLRERLPELLAHLSIECSQMSAVWDVLVKSTIEMTADDRMALEESTTFLKVCYEGLSVRVEQHRQDETDKPEKQKNASKPVKADSQKGFMPGISRKAILGDAFSARKLDRIADITLQSGRVAIMGKSLGIKSQATRQKNAYIMQLPVTDQKETILVKWMATPAEEKRAAKYLERGAHVGIRGEVRYDARFAKENILWAEQVTWFDIPSRLDAANDKRVELHAHTKMSPDGLADVGELVKTAARFGHPAIAITDHGVVQAFPDAYMASLEAKKKGHDIKLIYGVEAYLANDFCFEGNDAPLDEFIVLDIETTGLDPKCDVLIEIGAVLVRHGEVAATYQSFVDPQRPIPSEIVKLTGIDNTMVRDAPNAEQALRKLFDFIGERPVCAHNARFDVSFLRNIGQAYGMDFKNGVLDSLTLSRMLLPQLQRHTLASLVKHFNVILQSHHRANDDARATACIVLALLRMTDASSFMQLNGIGSTRALPNYHVVLLVKNKQGLKALYNLITASHLKHYFRRPVMPKSLIDKNRDNLVIGSGCEQGEVFRALLGGEDDAHIRHLASFYDYLEIQPIANNAFLLSDQREGMRIRSEEDLKQLNAHVLSLGKSIGKPVVATGDVHFLDPEDECFRRILLSGQGFNGVDAQPPLYLHTTDEMLNAFSDLSEEDAKEVVIKAPQRIAMLIEKNLAPFPDETYLPHEENGEQHVREIAISGAQALYGNPLPPMIEARIEKELHSIIKHGFEVLYLSAHRLVKKSMEDGYTVGSRGSVGSSFAALAMGISEINPLPAHYRCLNCFYLNFDIADTGAKCGPDLPDRLCPDCGNMLVKDGYDIPFEVFLGFDGDKVPDIDLNFSGEYQERAFEYVEKMFGSENVFRAGTVVGIKDKSAYGYVLKYMEETKQTISRAQTDYFAQGIAGVKRTTGQHPGGLVVLPMGMDIHDFTPLQRPADKEESQTITTHFDFNSLHDRLVKLDILGHDNPTMLRRLYEFSGIDPMTVPLDDAKLLSLFTGTGALGLEEKTLGYPTGTLGIPEFGTGFVIEMLKDTKPTTVSELLQISGLSHGTDVWIGNAQELIKSGTATLNECICTRDNIMNYLLEMGVEPRIAFNTMESVRKGRGLTAEMEQAMQRCNVPAWFAQSCKKIQYMFPKAHAAAYVLSALRIGYFKVHHPLVYYAAYFSVRADEIDACKVLGGLSALEKHIEQLNKKADASTRDEKEHNHLDVAREMLLRGYAFLPPDLIKSHVKFYLIEDGKLRMPLMSVAGLGENAAISVEQARKQKDFFSVEDLRMRTKLNASIIEKLRELGTLAELPDTAQVSFFQLMAQT